MREILFRGKRMDNGEWVEGYYAVFAWPRNDKPCIIEKDRPRLIWSVAPETVGQYIGCEDVTDRKIFEGDIVKMFYAHTKDERGVGVIVSDSCVLINGLGRMFTQDIFNFQVIGNVYDNPELLEVDNG